MRGVTSPQLLLGATAAVGGLTPPSDKQIRKAINRKIRHIIIIGDEELKTKHVILRDLLKGEQKLVLIENLINEIMNLD